MGTPPRPVTAFTLSKPSTDPAPVIFSSPHSGAHYPDSFLKALRVPLMDLRRTEDAFVDQLVADGPAAGGILISATHARAFVDLNRDARELDPEMFADGLPGPSAAPSPRVKAGLGCFPKIGACGDAIYAKKLSADEGRFRLAQIHTPYHDAIQREIAALHQEFGCALLIDCHSMPSAQPGRPDLPDIVLGDRFGSSCTSQLTSLVERTFRGLGLTVSRNAPYAGGYTTRRYGRPKRHIHALQIEINRRLYMNEPDVKPGPGMDRTRAQLASVCEEICRFAHRLCP